MFLRPRILKEFITDLSLRQQRQESLRAQGLYDQLKRVHQLLAASGTEVHDWMEPIVHDPGAPSAVLNLAAAVGIEGALLQPPHAVAGGGAPTAFLAPGTGVTGSIADKEAFKTLSKTKKSRHLFQVALEGCVADERGRFDTSAVRSAMVAAGELYEWKEVDNPTPFERQNVHMRLQEYYKNKVS